MHLLKCALYLLILHDSNDTDKRVNAFGCFKLVFTHIFNQILKIVSAMIEHSYKIDLKPMTFYNVILLNQVD